MPLPRLQMFELEDFGWFPSAIRDLATDYLHFMETLLGLHKAVAPLVLSALAETDTTLCVDLCSGGGGPVLALYDLLAASGTPVRITLTDKYPNLPAFGSLSARHPENILYVAESVDATKVPAGLAGMRTMFNAFHHFGPEQARSVLESAVVARQPIGIFEISERKLRMMIPMLFTPVLVWLATPFLRPFRWERLVWTYVIPLVPLTCWWDGMVSQWRAYSCDELLGLTRGQEGFTWKTGCLRLRWGVARATYVVGVPRARAGRGAGRGAIPGSTMEPPEPGAPRSGDRLREGVNP